MAKKKIEIDDSFWKESIDRSYQRVTDKDKVENSISESLQRLEKKRIVVRNKKSYRKVLAMAVCAAIFSVLVTGGIYQFVEPESSETNPAYHATNDSHVENPSGNDVKESKTIIKKDVIQKEKNDINDIKKGKITFEGGYKEANYINPTMINLVDTTKIDGNAKWTITSHKTKKVISRGSGKSISSEINKITEKQQNSSYIVTFEYKDKNGNQITLNEAFIIKVEKETPKKEDKEEKAK